jgi:hypothetical protein
MRIHIVCRICRRKMCILWGLVLAISLAMAGPAARAERPSTMKLFPEECFVFVRTPDANEMVERFKQTSTGRLARDPQLKPLVDKLYGEVGDMYAKEAQDKLGVSWEELQQLPHGEVAFAVVSRSVAEPAILLLVDQVDAPNVARRLLDKAIEEQAEKGGTTTKESIAGVEVTVVRQGNNQSTALGFFEKDNMVVMSNDADVLREVLRHWDPDTAPSSTDAAGDKADEATPQKSHYSGRTLAENANFAAILRQCRRKQDPPPQLIFYADPVGFFRQVAQGNPGMRIATATFPALGVDGILGVGGTVAWASGQYDDITHMHLLLQNPRAGVLQLIAFDSGDTKPQPWVPASTESYVTTYWNASAMYEKVIALVDKFQYAGATEKFVAEKISEPWGIDFPTQVLDNLAGRVTLLSGFDKPARMNSQHHLLAVELNDEEFARDTLQTIIDKYPDQFEKGEFGDVSYWHMGPKEWRDRPDAERPFAPCVAIMDGNLLLSGSPQLIERVVAARDGSADRLVDSADYQRMVVVLGQETSGKPPAMFLISRFEETLRHWYELLASEETRSQLEEHAKDNAFLAALAATLAENELPPFDQLAHYVAPSGGIVYDTDTGLHMISFTLRNETQP